MNSSFLKIRKAISILAILCCLASIANACPTCKETLSENDANMVRGYFWSIVFMMSMPFILFSGLTGYFYFLVRQARANATQPELSVSTAGS